MVESEFNSSIFKPNIPKDLEEIREQNNPSNEPVSGCATCGSTDLWGNDLAYGCTFCGAMLVGN